MIVKSALKKLIYLAFFLTVISCSESDVAPQNDLNYLSQTSEGEIGGVSRYDCNSNVRILSKRKIPIEVDGKIQIIKSEAGGFYILNGDESITKLKRNGAISWTNTLNYIKDIRGIQPTYDGGVVGIGSVENEVTDKFPVIFKIGNKGELVWDYQLNSDGDFTSIISGKGNTFWVSGIIDRNLHPDFKRVIYQFDEDGRSVTELVFEPARNEWTGAGILVEKSDGFVYISRDIRVTHYEFYDHSGTMLFERDDSFSYSGPVYPIAELPTKNFFSFSYEFHECNESTYCIRSSALLLDPFLEKTISRYPLTPICVSSSDYWVRVINYGKSLDNDHILVGYHVWDPSINQEWTRVVSEVNLISKETVRSHVIPMTNETEKSFRNGDIVAGEQSGEYYAFSVLDDGIAFVHISF